MADLLVSLDLSLGVIEIGTLFGTLLYGMTLVQCYMYATSCREDRLWLRVFVLFILYVLAVYFARINNIDVIFQGC
jgi:hypothetical protein